MSDQELLEDLGASCKIFGSRKGYKKEIAKFSKASKQFSSITIGSVSIDKVKSFVEACGRGAKCFELYLIRNVSSLDLIEVLNLMPNLEKLKVYLHFKCVIIIDETEKDVTTHSDWLKLPALHALDIGAESRTPSIYDFFSKFLPQNSIAEISYGTKYKKFVDEKLNAAVRGLFDKQKSIKKVSSCIPQTLKDLDLLTLEELDLKNDRLSHLHRKIDFQSQRELKVLKIDRCDAKFFKEIAKLENLEVLETGRCEGNPDFNLITNLKKLKKLKHRSDSFANFELHEHHRWISIRFEHLEELYLFENPINSVEVLECFPNLKFLRIKSNLKLNSFAKFLPKLEVLELHFFKSQQQTFEICELDTGIVNENFKSLTLDDAEVDNFWKFSKDLSEIHEIFPNIEVLDVKIKKHYDSWSDENPGKGEASKFFANFLKWKCLKNLEIGEIPARFCVSEFEEIAEELNKLARKVPKVFMIFEDKIDFYENWERFSFDQLMEGVAEEYEVFDDYQYDLLVDVEFNRYDFEDLDESLNDVDRRDCKIFTFRMISKEFRDEISFKLLEPPAELMPIIERLRAEEPPVPPTMPVEPVPPLQLSNDEIGSNDEEFDSESLTDVEYDIASNDGAVESCEELSDDEIEEEEAGDNAENENDEINSDSNEN